MSEFKDFVDPNANFDASNPLRPDAPRLEGQNKRGKRCELIDNSGDTLPHGELQSILNALIENDAFGFKTLSANGGETINLDRRESSHVQIGENLYRLIIFRYQARIERF